MFKNSLISLFVLSVVACGGGGSGPTPSPTPSPTPIVTNLAPTVSVTGQNTTPEFETVALNAIASDPDGSIVTIMWSIKSGPVETLIGADMQNVSFIAPSVDADTAVVLEVLVTDNEGATATSEFSVTISDIPTVIPNLAPTVTVTGQNTIQEFESLTLSAIADDIDGNIDTIMWSVKSGPVETLIGGDTQSVSFIAPGVAADTPVVLEVLVTDNDGATAVGEFAVTITATPNLAPTLSITGQDTVQEFESLALTAIANDSDGTIATFMWSVKSGPVETLIGGNTQSVSFIAPGVAADTPVVLEVLVTDNDGATTVGEFSVTITVAPVLGFADASLSFKLGTRQGSAIFYNNSLYLSDVSSGGVYSFAKFDNLHESIIDGSITDAPGIGYNFNGYVPSNSITAESADLTATVTSNGDIVSLIQAYDFNLGTKNLTSAEALSPGQLSTNLLAQNGNWLDTQFTSLNIDSGLNLTGVNVDGCQIEGIATETGSGFFSFSVVYSACEFSGDYEGVLQLQEVDEVWFLSWMAFDNNGQGVFAQIDTQVSQDEALSLTSELIPSLYVSSSSLLITKSAQIFTLEYTLTENTATPFVFDYTYDSAQELILGNGEGLPSDSTATNSTFSTAVTLPLERLDVTLAYEDLNNAVVTKSYPELDYIPSDQLLDSIAGQWGQLTISALGVLSGNVQDCSASGNIGNKQGRFWDIAITFSNCARLGSYTGVIVGAKGSVFDNASDVIITSLFNEAKTQGVNGILTRQ